MAKPRGALGAKGKTEVGRNGKKAVGKRKYTNELFQDSSKIRTQQILFVGSILYHYGTFYLERISSHLKNICPTKPIRYLVCEVGRKAYVFFLLPSKFIASNIF